MKVIRNCELEFFEHELTPKKLSYIRKFLNLTQKQFGEKLGKSRRTITYYETGGHRIPDHVITIINFMLKAHNKSISQF